MSSLVGERTLEHHAAILALQVMGRAPDWWRSVDTPTGVLAEARRQAQNKFDIHSPRARVVAAFALARIGDIDAARSELSADDDHVVRSLRAVRDASAEVFRHYDRDRTGEVFISVECECAWEPEHGLQLVFRRGRATSKVGPLTAT